MTFSWCKPYFSKNNLKAWSFIVLFISAFSMQSLAQDDIDVARWENGKSLFKSNCGACHHPLNKVTGPALAGSVERWEAEAAHDGVDGKEWLYKWVKNWNDPVASGNPYAIEMAGFDPNSDMQTNLTLSNEQIDDIFYYADNSTWTDPTKTPIGPGPDVATDAFPFKTFLFILVGTLLAVVLILIRVYSKLNEMAAIKAGKEIPAGTPFWKSNKLKTILTLIVLIAIGYFTVNNAVATGRQEGYQPTQPIKYNHELHAGVYEIECQYCHLEPNEGKHSNIPSVSMCMNCHKNIKSGPEYGRTETSKIYAAMGYNPNTDKYFDTTTATEEEIKDAYREFLASDFEGPLTEAQTKLVEANLDSTFAMFDKPVEWVRIHNLPDHVYFNHAQHVNAGNVECQTCHGAIEEMKVVEQHAPLSMGWCINCHRNTDVDLGNEYYEIYEQYHEDLASGEMDRVTVEDIGGTECQKCHY